MKFYNKTYDERLERVLGKYWGSDRLYINSATDHAYAFSNENLTDSIGKLNMQGKRVATVGSSADQVLMSVMCGAKDITLIDGGIFATAVAELKIAGVKNLEFDDFKEWWTMDKILDPTSYAKVSHDLSSKSRIFWDMIMLETTNDMSIKLNIFGESSFNGFFESEPYSLESCCSFYKNEVLFNSLKEELPKAKIKFKEAQLKDFPKVLKGKYDYIFLSNIFSYVGCGEYFDTVTTLYNNNLNEGGAIEIGYHYVDMPSVHYTECVRENIPEYLPNIEHHTIRGVIGLSKGIDAPMWSDSVTFLTKDSELEK